MNTIIERRESAEGYSAVVAYLNARWRVIACRDRIQWILQRQDATQSLHGAPWRSRSFCRIRAALIRVCEAFAAPLEPSALAILETLPARIEGGRS